MTNQQAKTIVLILIFGLATPLFVSCSGGPTQTAAVSVPTTAPTQKEAQATQTRVAFTPTSTPVLPDPAPTATAVNTLEPTPAPMTVVKEENGWITYRNEAIGYEISAPKGYVIKGGGISTAGNQLLGPAVPDEEINRLLSRYYGDSVYVWIWGTSPSGQDIPMIGIYAYDIMVYFLGYDPGPGGIGDYELTSRQETLQIDFHSYPVRFTVENRGNQPVGELAVLHLEKDGIEFMFGYLQPKDDPAAYQTYRKELWPEIRNMLETYKKLPEKMFTGDDPTVQAGELKDASPQGIAQALFEQYLAALQDRPLDELMTLSAYRIDEVEIAGKWQACAERNNAEFIAAITYSVKPAHWLPERWAEEGYATFDHWITRKKASLAVFRSGQDYTMKLLDDSICTGFH
jgi:hypothetical protein